MGNNYSINDMDDVESSDEEMNFVDEEYPETEYRDHLVNVLQQMVSSLSSRGTNPRTTKMPIIRKRPDLTIFKNTKLYREIKMQAGLAPDNTLPCDRWSLENILLRRENGVGPKPAGAFTENECRRISNLYIPNHKDQRLMSLEQKVFVGKFNKDGSRLITASQDHIIRIFDSSKGTYHRINRIPALDVSWCILDVDFSPDGQTFVYSTWSDYVFTVPVHGDQIKWHHINPDNNRSSIFSIRFSPCGNHLIGGSNDACINIYDRTTERRTRKLKSDPDEYNDINAISFINDSSDIFVSGCDNGIIKLWDQRCFNTTKPDKSVGVFVGHFDGITYIDSRNDGRYFLSNSKDQSIKIWDLRRTSSRDKEFAVRNSRSYSWDYRWDSVPREFYNPQRDMDGDSSVMTYRGHRITKSLIRARFSPVETTGQRYIYTGCGTGRVIIYDVLTGVIKEAIEGHKDIVRDVSWHPIRSEIVSSSWDWHVNLIRYKRNDHLKRRNSGISDESEIPLRRSRRIASERPLRRSRRIALRQQNGDGNSSDSSW